MILWLKHFTLLTCAVLSTLWLSTLARADTFYIQKGKSLTRVDNQDPGTVLAKSWVVRLYRSTDKSDGNSWGAEIGDSAADVMAQLDHDQKLQRWAERSCGCSWEPLGYFNFLGPIAVVEETDTAKREESHLEILLKQAERLKDLKEEYEHIQDIVDEEPKEKNPFSGVGNVLKEYTDNLKSAIQLETRLKGSLTNFAQQENKMFDQSLSELSSYEDLCEKAIPGLGAVIDAFALTPEPTPTPGGTSPGFEIKFGLHAICDGGPCP